MRRMATAPEIRAITFDVGGTLIEPWPSVGHVYAEVAARHGVASLNAELLTARFLAAWRAQGGRAERRADWEAIVDQTFSGFCEPPPSQTFFPELYDRFSEPASWRIFEDVVPALAALRERRVRLGIVSNWDERLRPLLHRLQLAPWFDAVVVSCEVGARKPDPAIFQRAARELGVAPAAVLHVGDSWEDDVLAARRAGLRALQIHRGEPPADGERIASLGAVGPVADGG
jgi:putative hydrolase of the HAD superfamily